MNALIFDLDGTLVESLPGIAASLNRSLTLHGLPGHSHRAVRSFIGNGTWKLVARALATVSRGDLTESVHTSFVADYALSWRGGTEVCPGIPGLLAALRSREIPLAVLSNKPDPFTREIIADLFPPDTFAVVLGNRPGLPLKPHPAAALDIASSLHIPPQECAIIGDSTVDLETARNASMKAIAVTWGYHDSEKLSDAGSIATSVPELAAILNPPADS